MILSRNRREVVCVLVRQMPTEYLPSLVGQLLCRWIRRAARIDNHSFPSAVSFETNTSRSRHQSQSSCTRSKSRAKSCEDAAQQLASLDLAVDRSRSSNLGDLHPSPKRFGPLDCKTYT